MQQDLVLKLMFSFETRLLYSDITETHGRPVQQPSDQKSLMFRLLLHADDDVAYAITIFQNDAFIVSFSLVAHLHCS